MLAVRVPAVVALTFATVLAAVHHLTALLHTYRVTPAVNINFSGGLDVFHDGGMPGAAEGDFRANATALFHYLH